MSDISDTAWRLIGQLYTGGVLIVADHASSRVPIGIDLGLTPALLTQHIALDIGVAEVAERMVRQGDASAAYLGNVSRLVCDFNRDEQAPDVFPCVSDGHAIPGNVLDHTGYEERLALYFRPYHQRLAALLDAMNPALILSLHSFTPCLASSPDTHRPWHVGVLYHRDERAAQKALAWLADENNGEAALCVGDQNPYSGRDLNATMNTHAEARGLPYVGIEIRQDQISDAVGQVLWADRLGKMCRALVVPS